MLNISGATPGNLSIVAGQILLTVYDRDVQWFVSMDMLLYMHVSYVPNYAYDYIVYVLHIISSWAVLPFDVDEQFRNFEKKHFYLY